MRSNGMLKSPIREPVTGCLVGYKLWPKHSANWRRTKQTEKSFGAKKNEAEDSKVHEQKRAFLREGTAPKNVMHKRKIQGEYKYVSLSLYKLAG